MNIAEIQFKKRHGDIAEASKIIGIKTSNGSKALSRPNSKHHLAVVNALISIITVREILFNQNQS